MILVIGLGNPGEKYFHHRHNTGFQVVDAVARAHEALFGHQTFFHADIAKTEEFLLVKPDTFMNESGIAVRALKKQYPDAMVVVVYDEITIPIGDIKCSFDRGDGGHNGVASIIKELGTKEFFRIRVGIRPVHDSLLPRIAPPDGIEKFVLSDFAPFEEEKRAEGVAKAVAVIEALPEKTIPALMTEFN